MDRERAAREQRNELRLPDGQQAAAALPGDVLALDGLFQPAVVECYSAASARAALSAPPLPSKTGLAGAASAAIAAVDLGCRREVSARVLVAGGVAATPGLVARLQAGLRGSAGPFAGAASVACHPQPQHSAWLGGAALASLSCFGGICTGREAFYELQDAALRRDCQLG